MVEAVAVGTWQSQQTLGIATSIITAEVAAVAVEAVAVIRIA